MSVIPKIISINIIVFLLWFTYAPIDPEFMINNFLVSFSGVFHGRWWTLLTSVFSHNMFFHLFINMFVLFNFGFIVEKYLTAWRFLIFYLLAGIGGSMGHILVCAYILKQSQIMALGASGAISGVVALFALLYPKQKIFLLGILPISAIWAVVLITGIDLWGVINQVRGVQSPIGHGAHLGGALVGALTFLIIKHKERLRTPKVYYELKSNYNE